MASRIVDGDSFLEYNGKPFTIEIKTLAGSQVKALTILATQLREKGINASVPDRGHGRMG